MPTLDDNMKGGWTTSLTPSNNKNNLPGGITPQKPVDGIGQLETGVNLQLPSTSPLVTNIEKTSFVGNPTSGGSIGGGMTDLASPMSDKFSDLSI